MENKKRRKKLLISGLLLLISGIILFAIAAGLALSFASGAEGFPSLLHAFAYAALDCSDHGVLFCLYSASFLHSAAVQF